ncbi:hypothetical protein [Kineosporia sp. A_224]|uniref:hypothetical protein n=1 Tax=Kineosporia sp. A_224 TaxID=1962180 RepID=UPI000B4A7353|nr:hypothetical protein [Kineosporia sp. A_224]
MSTNPSTTGTVLRCVRAVAAVGLCTLALTACGPGGSSAAPPSGAGTSPGSAAAQPAPKSLTAACDAVAKAVDEATGKFAEALTSNATGAAAQDAAAQQRSADAIHGIFVAWAGAMRGQVGRTGDADLDAILTDYATEMDKVAASITTHADISDGGRFDSPELQAVNARLEKKCGTTS